MKNERKKERLVKIPKNFIFLTTSSSQPKNPENTT